MDMRLANKVAIVSGAASRSKVVDVCGLTAPELRARMSR